MRKKRSRTRYASFYECCMLKLMAVFVQKRRKTGPGSVRGDPVDPNTRARMRQVFDACYKAVTACEDETGRKRCELFRELPSRHVRVYPALLALALTRLCPHRSTQTITRRSTSPSRCRIFASAQALRTTRTCRRMWQTGDSCSITRARTTRKARGCTTTRSRCTRSSRLRSDSSRSTQDCRAQRATRRRRRCMAVMEAAAKRRARAGSSRATTSMRRRVIRMTERVSY